MDGQAPNIEELKNNLKHQLTLYRQLVDLLREEKEHIVGARLKEIREATYAKEAILDEIHREELRRKRWVRDAAISFVCNEHDLTIEKIASYMGEREHYEALTSLKNTLIHFIKKAKEMNQENRALTENALRDAQAMKRNILGLSADKPQTYGPKGNMGNGATERGARFLSKEA